jgi:general secretion pathway protein G
MMDSISKKISYNAFRKGFTLIEMIVVIGILGILAIALLATINPIAQLQKSNDARRKSDLESVQRALELYYNDNGKYPTSSGNFKILSGVTTLAWGSSWQPYMATLPTDPLPSYTYVYYSPPTANGQTYYLYASLQRGANDSQVCNKGNACTSLSGSGFPGSAACGAVCNYGVSSSNVSP